MRKYIKFYHRDVRILVLSYIVYTVMNDNIITPIDRMIKIP